MKTASLFIWGMVAGAVVFGLSVKLIFTQPREAPVSGPPRTAPAEFRFASYADTRDSRVTAIVRAADSAGKAVVSIGVIKHRLVRPYFRSPFSDPMFEEFFRQFFPETEKKEEIPGLGSGFIVDREGHILTNEHVIRNADEINITLPDGRQFDARLLGSDVQHDIAVLKVDAEGLPYVKMGNSDDLLVGEWAVAIGNPFGYLLNDTKPTVTAGVISAVGRDVSSGGSLGGVYKDMIQTDAAINPGNSGGPLINTRGEVIGINTFIITKSGGSMGMGFAIPINRAGRVFREIVKYGKVRRPWIGITVQEISPWVARRLGIRDMRGLLVTRLERGCPAEQAGMEVGDVIKRIQGKEVTNARGASRIFFGMQIGDKVTFGIDRDGKAIQITFPLKERPHD